MSNPNKYNNVMAEKCHIDTNVPSECRILALQSNYCGFIGTLERALNKLGITFDLITTPFPYAENVFTTQFNAINFNDYDLIVIGWSFPTIPSQEVTNALNERKTELENWINLGGGLVVLTRFNIDNVYDYLPFPLGSVTQHANDVNIVMPTHPVMNGLTDAQLSGWNNSYHNYFNPLDPAYEVLCINNTGDPVTVVATCGGRIILTGQDPDWHYAVQGQTAAGILLDNMISWACRTQNLNRGIIL